MLNLAKTMNNCPDYDDGGSGDYHHHHDDDDGTTRPIPYYEYDYGG